MIARALLLAVSLALPLLAGGCASNAMPGALLPVAETVPGADVVKIAVSTSRGLNAETGQFNNDRSRTLHFQALTVSIPPAHKVGDVEWPQSLPGDPKLHFVTLKNEVQNQAAFVASVERALPPSGEALVFVHGYNTHHEEGAFRLAQIIADSKMPQAAVLFSWPSRGEIKDYVTDRESVMSSRNRLSDMLTLLSRSPRVKKINILAHSMGTMLTAETLYIAKLRGDPEFGGKLDSVMLAAPDIDVDVFQSQFEVIGKRNRPTVIMVSRDDRALAVSRRIAGDVVRVGAASPRAAASVEAIKRLGLTVIDLSDVKAGDSGNHAKFATSPAILQRMGGNLVGGLSQTHNPVGSFIVNAAGAVLEAPVNVLRTVTGQ